MHANNSLDQHSTFLKANSTKSSASTLVIWTTAQAMAPQAMVLAQAQPVTQPITQLQAMWPYQPLMLPPTNHPLTALSQVINPLSNAMTKLVMPWMSQWPTSTPGPLKMMSLLSAQTLSTHMTFAHRHQEPHHHVFHRTSTTSCLNLNQLVRSMPSSTSTRTSEMRSTHFAHSYWAQETSPLINHNGMMPSPSNSEILLVDSEQDKLTSGNSEYYLFFEDNFKFYF